MPEQRKQELIKLAGHLDSTSGERYEKAAKAIRERLGGRAPAEQAPKLEFLSRPTWCKGAYHTHFQPILRASARYSLAFACIFSPLSCTGVVRSIARCDSVERGPLSTVQGLLTRWGNIAHRPPLAGRCMA